jgi:hypothetical protein
MAESPEVVVLLSPNDIAKRCHVGIVRARQIVKEIGFRFGKRKLVVSSRTFEEWIRKQETAS